MSDRGYGGDWRAVSGQLLYPELLTEEIVTTTERSLGVYQAEAQLQQNPCRRDGRLFQNSRLKVISDNQLPQRFDSVDRFFDLASTESGGDFTAGILMGIVRDGHDARVYILDIVREQSGPDAVLELLIATAFRDKAQFGDLVRIGWESQPGASGKFLNDQLQRRLRGNRTFTLPSTNSKTIRAEPFATAVGLGEVSIAEGPLLSAFIDEMELFPGGRHDDMIDAASGAYQALLSSAKSKGGVVLAAERTTIPSAEERCRNPDCKRPAFQPSGFCCARCKKSFESDEAQTCEPNCNLVYNDWYLERMPDEVDRPSWSRRR